MCFFTRKKTVLGKNSFQPKQEQESLASSRFSKNYTSKSLEIKKIEDECIEFVSEIIKTKFKLSAKDNLQLKRSFKYGDLFIWEVSFEISENELLPIIYLRAKINDDYDDFTVCLEKIWIINELQGFGIGSVFIKEFHKVVKICEGHTIFVRPGGYDQPRNEAKVLKLTEALGITPINYSATTPETRRVFYEKNGYERQESNSNNEETLYLYYIE